jgi:hypothetical protein
MTLDEWMTKSSISAEDFGKWLECSGQAVRRYRSGERSPDALMSERIVMATDGQVTVQDMHNTRLAFLSSTEPQPQSEVA